MTGASWDHKSKVQGPPAGHLTTLTVSGRHGVGWLDDWPMMNCKAFSRRSVLSIRGAVMLTVRNATENCG
jgi:hypothetical protein